MAEYIQQGYNNYGYAMGPYGSAGGNGPYNSGVFGSFNNGLSDFQKTFYEDNPQSAVAEWANVAAPGMAWGDKNILQKLSDYFTNDWKGKWIASGGPTLGQQHFTDYLSTLNPYQYLAGLPSNASGRYTRQFVAPTRWVGGV